MIIIKYYITQSGASVFTRWFFGLDKTLQAKVSSALDRIERGQPLYTKSLKHGLREIRIHSGGGLRVYYAEDGAEIILLLGGGQKDDQKRDIEKARNRLTDYLARKEQKNG